MPTDKVQGEGDYEAARNYDDATREFVEAGEVQKAARDAEPKDRAEADEMERAEQEGKSHSKGEVPGETSPTTIAQPPKGN
jgi:hypothetical protein